jgi:hypothetical protein
MPLLPFPLTGPLGGNFSTLVTAIIVPNDQEVVVGSIVKLDGRSSFSQNGDITAWSWAFTQVPIGSQVASSGFTNLDEDGSVVSFNPDTTGTYKISLMVSDGTFVSYPTEAIVEVRVIIVPYHQGFIPDASFIWNYLSDFWTLVADRKRFETVWSAAIQVASSEMLKLYQYQFNKSIRDIQDIIQKRWINYSPALPIDKESTSFILADDTAGLHASTFVLDPNTSLPLVDQPSYANEVTIPTSDGSFVSTSYGLPTSIGRILKVGTRSYTFSRAFNTSSSISIFFADRNVVPTGFLNKPWRFSSTIISSTTDFETQGVCPGDVLEVEITRTDLGLVSRFFAQIVSVDRNRMGLVLNLSDLVDGVAAKWMTSDIQITLASDLIVSGLATNSDGSLAYALDAGKIKDLLNSVKFRRQYFETVLTSNSLIDLGVFSIQARPVQVFRNKKVAVDGSVVSIPILQEYIKQPSISSVGGALSIVSDDGTTTSIARAPYLLSENLDYIIDNEAQITGLCNLTAGNPDIDLPLGDLIDRSIEVGDTIAITAGITTKVYNIREVVDSTTLKIDPTPNINGSLVSYTITRRLPGKFIRFVDTAFTKTSPAPKRLWAEVTYFDNGQAIEDNFGVLVRVTRDDLNRAGSQIPYKSAVAGLMFALSNGPTIANLQLSGQILLGLPFAQTAGIIRDINPFFRVRNDGSPLFGRILIESVDNSGTPIGVTNIYLYPQGSQIFDVATNKWVPLVPDFSGIAINPATGVEYQIGDFVAQFAVLSKGVQIQEYISTPDWVDKLVAQGDIQSRLQKYHSFRILMNSDIIASADIDIVAQFIKQARAHYLRLLTTLLKSFDDTESITDSLSFSRDVDFFDSSDLGLPSAVSYDDADDNDSYLTVDGTMYSLYHSGTDLVTTKDSSTVTSALGGLLNPRSLPFIENWDSHKVRPGDLLIVLTGVNAGDYPVLTVPSDTSMTVDLGTGNVKTLSGQKFQIYRPIQNPIFQGSVSVTNGSPTVSVSELGGSTAGGIGAVGVAVGDILVFANLSVINSTVSHRYTVIEVHPGVTPTVKLSANISEATGSYTAWIVREKLIHSGVVSPAVNPYSGNLGVFHGTCTSGTRYFNFVDVTSTFYNDWLNIALIRPGDALTLNGITYVIMRFEPANRRVLVTPSLLTNEANAVVTVTLRADRGRSTVAFDFNERLPADYLQLEMDASLSTGDNANTSNGSTDVTLTVNTFSGLLTLPGDYLILRAGADSTRDVGYGQGVFPIQEIIGGTTARLMDQLTVTGTFRYGIRRNLPNEG